MALNAMAGRRRGDSQYHPILPWVIDFTSSTGNWRDLTRTKYRINKGDQMLDFTFQSPQNAHHVTEPLSETTYYIYLARRTPVDSLKKHVRAHYEPREYPSSITRMYEWTPDECIPEFYDDENVFVSMHDDMEDLELPTSWVTDRAEFIRLHRAALESGHVSRRLHHWIDLIFGYKLTGEAAISSKNVMLVRDADRTMPSRYGFVQLFRDPHPQRFSSSTVPLPISSPNRGRPIDLSFYEESVRFASRYFLRSQYHALPLLPDRLKNDQNELYADDMFAMGCLLAELYNQQPLFNSRSLQHYLVNYDGHNRLQLVPQLQSIPQPARSIVETLIDPQQNRGKKVLSLRDSKSLFPSYFKYAYWFLSTFYTLPTYGERYGFVIKHIISAKDSSSSDEEEPDEKKTKKVEFKKGADDLIDDKDDMSYSGNLMSMPYEGLELVLPHVLQMFLRAQRRQHGDGADVDFGHITLWRYGLRILRAIYKHNEQDAQLFGKLRRCETVKKIVRNKILDLYIESERSSHTAKQFDHVQLIQSLNHYLLSYPFVSFVFHVVLSENEIAQKSRDKDRQRMFLEQVVPFLVEALFAEGPEKAHTASNSLCKLAQDDFGILLSMRHVIDPVLSRVLRIVQSQLRVSVNQRQHRERNKQAVKALLNLGMALGPSTLLSHYIPKFLGTLLEIVKERTEPVETPFGFDEHTTDVVTDVFEMFEYLLHRLSLQTGHQTIVECIVSNNEPMFEELILSFHRMEVHHFERLATFLCHLFLNMEDLELTIRSLRSIATSLSSLFCAKLSLDESTRSLNMIRGIVDTTGFIDPSTLPQISVDIQEKKSSTLRMLMERIRASVTNSPSPHHQNHNFITTPHQHRSKSLDVSLVSKHTLLQTIEESILETHDDSVIVAQTSDMYNAESQTDTPLPVEEETIKSREHFLKAAFMYRELCCVMGNSTMREALANSRSFEDYLSTSQKSPSSSAPASPTIAHEKPPLFRAKTLPEIPPLSFDHRVINVASISPLTPTTPMSYAHKVLSDVDHRDTHLVDEPLHERPRSWLTKTKWDDDDDSGFKGKLIHEFNEYDSSIIRCLDRIENDERLFVTGGRDQAGQSCVKLWNMIDGRSTRTILPHGSSSVSRRDIIKVRFLDRNRGRRIACSDASNVYVVDSETAKPIFTINSSGVGYYGILPQSTDFLHPRGNEMVTFDCVQSDPNLLMVSSGDATVGWYDLRVNARDLPCYEWRLWMTENDNHHHRQSLRDNLANVQANQSSDESSGPFLSNSNGISIRSLSSLHPQDRHIAVGLSTGVVFLLEKRSGLILDSFQAHEKPISKMMHYPAQTGHLFTIDTRSPSVRMWNTESAPARSGKCFSFTNQNISPESENTQELFSRDRGSIHSFDVHCAEDADQLFAVTTTGSLLYTKNTSFTANVDIKITARRDAKRGRRKMNSIMSRFKSFADGEMDIFSSEVISMDLVNACVDDDKFTDVNYLPLHKLLLATTMQGKVKLFS
jgi:hypothetical protein